MRAHRYLAVALAALASLSCSSSRSVRAEGSAPESTPAGETAPTTTAAAAPTTTAAPETTPGKDEDVAPPPAELAGIIELIEERPTSRERITARFEEIGAWVEASGGEADAGDFGEWGFVRGIALYQLRRYDDAADAMFAYLDAQGGDFPTDEMDDHIGRTFIAAVRPSLQAGEFDRAQRAAVLACRYYDPVIACRSIGRLFADRGDPKSCDVVNAILETILAREDLDARAKQTAIRGLYSVAMPPDTSEDEESEPGEVFTKPVSFGDYKGKVLLVDFWATWCGPCIREMPHVVSLYEDYEEKGLEILGVSLDHADAEKRLDSTMRRLGMTWDQVYEGKGWSASLARKHGVRSIPTTLLYDRQGKLRYRGLRGDALARGVAELLAETAR